MFDRISRVAIVALTLFSALVALLLFYCTVAPNGVNAVEWASLALLGILMSSVAFSFWMTMLGVVDLWSRPCSGAPAKHDPTPLPPTAVVMPIYNESPATVFAAARAMMLSLARTGQSRAFDFYLLSDTTDPDVWLEEEHAWARLATQIGSDSRLYYRHRPRNHSRKAGNIADFCSRWGTQYRYMIVLDADSMMEGATLVEMTRRMERDGRLGILQVPPVAIDRQSLFARVQQFAQRVYGPVFARGYAAWSKCDGNYWGHNAIIRVEPFRQHCGLPILPGRAPLGGEILSHDFVEAALMVRAGYKVELAYDLGGSYEQCPTTLFDYAIRDQRWCQGNLQHLQLLVREGFKPISRGHFAIGVMSYLASPLWLAFLSLSALAFVLDGSTPHQSHPGGNSLVLFGAAMAMLLAPKLLGVATLARSPARLAAHGGLARVLASTLIEIVLSVLIAPLMAVYHTQFVVATLCGHVIRWNAQRRDESRVDLASATRLYWPHTIVALGLGTVVLAFAPQLLPWSALLLAGPLFSLPLAMALGSVKLGQWLARHRLLSTPEEFEPPELLLDYRDGLAQYEQQEFDRSGLFVSVLTDPKSFALHLGILHATDSHVKANEDELRPIAAAILQRGARGIDANGRRLLLSDPEALIHVHHAWWVHQTTHGDGWAKARTVSPGAPT